MSDWMVYALLIAAALLTIASVVGHIAQSAGWL